MVDIGNECFTRNIWFRALMGTVINIRALKVRVFHVIQVGLLKLYITLANMCHGCMSCFHHVVMHSEQALYPHVP